MPETKKYLSENFVPDGPGPQHYQIVAKDTLPESAIVHTRPPQRQYLAEDFIPDETIIAPAQRKEAPAAVPPMSLTAPGKIANAAIAAGDTIGEGVLGAAQGALSATGSVLSTAGKIANFPDQVRDNFLRRFVWQGKAGDAQPVPDNLAQQAGGALQQQSEVPGLAPSDPENPSLAYRTGQGVGMVAPILAAGAATGGASLPVQAGIQGAAGAGLIGSMEYQGALKEGKSETEAMKIAAISAGAAGLFFSVSGGFGASVAKNFAAKNLITRAATAVAAAGADASAAVSTAIATGVARGDDFDTIVETAKSVAGPAALIAAPFGIARAARAVPRGDVRVPDPNVINARGRVSDAPPDPIMEANRVLSPEPPIMTDAQARATQVVPPAGPAPLAPEARPVSPAAPPEAVQPATPPIDIPATPTSPEAPASTQAAPISNEEMSSLLGQEVNTQQEAPDAPSGIDNAQMAELLGVPQESLVPPVPGEVPAQAEIVAPESAEPAPEAPTRPLSVTQGERNPDVAQMRRPVAASNDPKRYHGSSGPIVSLKVAYEMPQAQNLYGPGFYTTRDPEIAGKYTKKGKHARGENAKQTLYSVKWAGDNPPNLIDLDKPLPEDAYQTAHSLFQDILDIDPETPGRDVYRQIKTAMGDARWYISQAEEMMHVFADQLTNKGYDGFTHEGGNIVGNKKHQVDIFFNPRDPFTNEPNIEITPLAAAMEESPKKVEAAVKRAQRKLDIFSGQQQKALQQMRRPTPAQPTPETPAPQEKVAPAEAAPTEFSVIPYNDTTNIVSSPDGSGLYATIRTIKKRGGRGEKFEVKGHGNFKGNHPDLEKVYDADGKDRAIEAAKEIARRESAPNDGPVPNRVDPDTLAKWDIYPSRIFGGKTMFAVRGEGKRGGGDRLYDSEEAARAGVEEQKAEEQRGLDRAAEIEARDAKAAADKAEHDSINGFTDEMTPMARGRAVRILDVIRGRDGIYVPRREHIERHVNGGGRNIEKVEPKNGKTKYYVDDYEATRVEYEYASYLIRKAEEAQAPAEAAPAPTDKQSLTVEPVQPSGKKSKRSQSSKSEYVIVPPDPGLADFRKKHTKYGIRPGGTQTIEDMGLGTTRSFVFRKSGDVSADQAIMEAVEMGLLQPDATNEDLAALFSGPNGYKMKVPVPPDAPSVPEKVYSQDAQDILNAYHGSVETAIDALEHQRTVARQENPKADMYLTDKILAELKGEPPPPAPAIQDNFDWDTGTFSGVHREIADELHDNEMEQLFAGLFGVGGGKRQPIRGAYTEAGAAASVAPAVPQTRAEKRAAKAQAKADALAKQAERERIAEAMRTEHEHPDAAIEAINKKNTGLSRKGLWERIKDQKTSLVHGFTRAQIHIPNTPEFAAVNDQFRMLKQIAANATHEVSGLLSGITDPLNEGQYNTFSRYVIMRAMLENVTVFNESPKAPYDSLEKVKEYFDHLQAAVDQPYNEALRTALKNHDKVQSYLVDQIKKHDVMPGQKNHEFYFHQQVLEYATGSQKFKGLNTPNPAWQSFKSPRQKTDLREFNINMDWMQATYEYMVHAAIEIEKAKWLKQTDKMPMGAGPRKGKTFGVPQKELEGQARAENEGLLAERGIFPPGEKPFTAREMQKMLGTDYKDWRSFVPEGYRAFQSVEGNYFYKALGVSERQMEAMIEAVIEDPDLYWADFTTDVKALGKRRPYLIWPEEVVRQMESMKKKQTPMLKQLHQAWLRFVRKNFLLLPTSFIRWQTRNAIGDVAAPIGGNAFGVFGKAPQAAKELRKLDRGDLDLPHDLETAIRYAVAGSGRAARTLEGFEDIEQIKEIYKSATKGGKFNPINGVEWYYDTVGKYANFRENILRYASYLYYLEKIEDGTLYNYGGANGEHVRQIIHSLGKERGAAHLARNLMIDYFDLSENGEWIRSNIMQFYAWKEGNIGREKRFVQSAMEEGDIRSRLIGPDGKPIDPMTMTDKARIELVKRMWQGKAILAMVGVSGAFFLYNWLVKRDVEEALPEYEREGPHLNLYMNQTGEPVIMRNVDQLGDIMNDFGIYSLTGNMREVMNGQMSVGRWLLEGLKSPAKAAISQLDPAIALGVGAITNTQLFPDPFNARHIESDQAIASGLGLSTPYKWLTGNDLASNQFERDFLGWTVARNGALNDSWSYVSLFLQAKGKGDRGKYPPNEEFKALKDAYYANKPEAYVQAKEAYIKTKEGKSEYQIRSDFQKSLERMNPYLKVPSALREEFNNFLTDEQEKRWNAGQKFVADTQDGMLLWFDGVFRRP